MTRTTATMTLTVAGVLLLAPAANAADGRSKAQVEHDERQSAVTAPHLTKAQVEHAESAARPAAVRTTGTTSPVDSGGSDAAAWQLAVAAALGAAATGGVVLVGRQVGHHRHAMAH